MNDGESERVRDKERKHIKRDRCMCAPVPEYMIDHNLSVICVDSGVSLCWETNVI